MLFLKSKGFYFDGKHTSDFQLRMVSLDSNEQTQPFGLNKTLELESTGTMVSGLKSVKYNSVKFDIVLTKSDGISLLPFSEQEKFEIIQWLFQDEFKPISFDDQKDVLYYVVFTTGTNYQNGFKQGYLKLTMELNAPCGFTHPTKEELRVVGETTIEVFNRTNVERFSYPDIEFKLMGDSCELIIENLTTGEKMSFKEIAPQTHAYCYNESMKQLSCLNDPSYNLRPCFNGTWLRFCQGRNVIRIQATDAYVSIIGQSKIALQ